MPVIQTMTFNQFLSELRQLGLHADYYDVRQDAITGKYPFISVRKKKHYIFEISVSGFNEWVNENAG